MSRWIIAPTGLIEPVPAPEIFVDGIGAIEAIGGGNLRYYLIQKQLPIERAVENPQKIIVAKIVGPLGNVPTYIGQLATCVWPEDEPPPAGPRLVKK